MKKEYHYTISRTDRIYLVSFVVILLGWELIKGLFPGGKAEYAYKPQDKKEYRKDQFFEQKTNYPDHFRKTKYNPRLYQAGNKEINFSFTPPSQPISIMTATINELTAMGFSVKVAFNIQKFISAGGNISNDLDLLKIYGMDSIQLEKVKPYIIYAPERVKPIFASDKTFSSKKANALTDLNTATIADLESLKGIGTVLAERIIRFRESIGGFVDVHQLRDCYGITPELFEELKSNLTASGSPEKIMINAEDITSIAHPYLNKKMIRLIEAYKDHHGPFLNASELKKVYPADSTWFNKILPYISFEIIDTGSK